MSNLPITNTSPSNLNIQRGDLLYLLNIIKSQIKAEINCHAIGTIQNFDPITQTCSVTFNYQKVLKKRNAVAPSYNSYTDVIVPYPMLIRVPVIFLGGGGSYLTFPISGVKKDSNGNVTYPGDTCIIFFIDRDIDLWLELGGTNNPPNTERLHDLSDGVALVGLSSIVKPLPNFNPSVINMVDGTGDRLTQSGMGAIWFASVAPSGWLLCNGSSYSTTTYPELFAAIGYTWGGSGNNFNVPDMRGNVPAGYKSGDPNFGTLAGTLGEPTHLLTGPESGVQQHNHTYGGVNGASGGADVGIPNDNGSGYITANAGPTNAQTPHNNIQPTIVVNWIIKI